MARESTQHIVVTKTADGAVVANTIVKIGASGAEVTEVDAGADTPFGIARHDAKDGAPVDVVIQGRTKVKASGAVTAGDLFSSDTDGKARNTVGVGHYVFGRVLDDAAAEDEIVDCVIDGPSTAHAAIT